MRQIRVLFLFLLVSMAVSAQSVPLSDQASVSVLTCGTGPEIYALFGHTAIRIKDPAQNLDIVYNYGMFDFGTPNFALKFVKGDMKYFVAASSFGDFIIQYDYEKRSVSEQVLAIPLEKKQQLFEELNSVLFSDAKYYTYKFIDRNCTNMAADVLNKVLGSKIIYKRKNTDTTYRNIIFPYFNGHFYEQWGTSVLFGTKVDQKATTLFLPTEFETALYDAKYEGHPLVEYNRNLLHPAPQHAPFSWWNNIYTYLLFLVLVVALNRKGLNAFYLILVGLLGLFFCFDSLYSLHEELAMNYNVLLFNPLLIAVAFLYLRNSWKWLYRTAIFCAFCIGLYLILVFNKAHLLIVLPMVIANLILLGRMILKSRSAQMEITARDKTTPY